MADPRAARLLIDKTGCPVPGHGGGLLVPGPPALPLVLIENFPAAKTNDLANCALPPPDVINMGSPNVYINNQHASREFDTMFHGGKIISGADSVGIGILGDGVTVQVNVPKSAGGGAVVPGKGDKKDEEEKDDKDKKDDRDKKDDKQKGVFARIALVAPGRPIVGQAAIFDCRSWDPDTGGTQDQPNPGAIRVRHWCLRGERVVQCLQNSPNIQQFQAFISAFMKDGEVSIPFEVSLAIEDEQGHTDETVQRFLAFRTKEFKAPVPIILYNDKPVTGKILVGKGAYVLLYCGSYDPDDRDDGTPTPENITSREWTVTAPDGRIKNDVDQALTRIAFTTQKEGSYRVRLLVEDDDDDRHRRASVEIAVEVTTKYPVPVINDPLSFAVMTERWNNQVPVVGDLIKAESLSHDAGLPNGQGIATHHWRVEPSQFALVREDSGSVFVFEALAEGVFKVYLSVVNNEGVKSVGEVMVGRAVSRALNADSLREFFMEKVITLGITAGVAAFFAGGASLVGAAVLTSLAGQMIAEGLKGLGVNGILADLISAGCEIGGGAIKAWNSREAFWKLYLQMRDEGKVGSHALETINEMYRDTLSKMRPGDEALRESLTEAKEYLTQKAGEAGFEDSEAY